GRLVFAGECPHPWCRREALLCRELGGSEAYSIMYITADFKGDIDIVGPKNLVSSFALCMLCVVGISRVRASDNVAGAQPFVYRPTSASCVNFIDYSQCPKSKNTCKTVLHLFDLSYPRVQSILELPKDRGLKSVNVMLLNVKLPKGFTVND